VIRKVISGGQNGVDLAALRAAKSLGVATGGLMPQGWLTLDGPRPEYAKEFGMFECRIKGYPARTNANVADADFTLQIAKNHISPGELCTIAAINRHDKPHASVSTRYHNDPRTPEWDSLDVTKAIDAIRACREHVGHDLVLNIAGNSEKTAPGIGDVAFRIVRDILERLREG